MDRKTLLVGLGSFLLIALVGVAVAVFARPESFRGTTYSEPYPVAAEIKLMRSDGSRFQLSELRGEIVLLFFGYTSCPDVCPTTMADLNLALSHLDENDARKVKVLFVTVDPERDSPVRVQEYVDHFNNAFIGLGGSQSDLEKVWSDYGVYREISPGASASGYIVNHTARVTMIDPQGQLRVSYSFDAPVEDVVHDLNLLLQESQN